MRMTDGMKMVKRLNHHTGDVEYDWLYFLDGQEVSEEVYRGRYPLPKDDGAVIARGQIRRGWPLKSEACAVHPDQVDEANARNREHGVNVEYEPGTGKAIIPDRAARRRLLRIEGLVDRDSFNGN